jgi:hypothetical protein
VLTTQREHRWRAALAVIGLASLSVSDAGTDPLQANVSCHAEVTTTDNNVTQCPQATLHFHVAVSDCRDSKGTFVYRYLTVVPGIKKAAHRTAAWISTDRNSDITDRVPLACDEEIDDVEVQRVDCSCMTHGSTSMQSP